MPDQKLYEQIEAYINGELAGTELSDFEARIQSNKEFAEQVEMLKDIDVAVSDKRALNFQKIVSEEGQAFIQEQDRPQATVKKINSKLAPLAIAASVLLLVAAFFIWKPSSRVLPSGPELFAQHFETYDLNASLRGTANAAENFDLGIQKYQAGAYAEATETFQQLSASDQSDMITAFCLGNASINQKPANIAVAQAAFEKVIAEGNSVYVSAAKWYLALILIKQDNSSAAKSLLNELSDAGGNWGDKAKSVISQMAM